MASLRGAPLATLPEDDLFFDDDFSATDLDLPTLHTERLSHSYATTTTTTSTSTGIGLPKSPPLPPPVHDIEDEAPPRTRTQPARWIADLPLSPSQPLDCKAAPFVCMDHLPSFSLTTQRAVIRTPPKTPSPEPPAPASDADPPHGGAGPSPPHHSPSPTSPPPASASLPPPPSSPSPSQSLKPLPPSQRRPLRPPTSVSDLISPLWCELQTEYTLTATPRGKRTTTAAMSSGTSIHQQLESEIHTAIPIDASAFTQEDVFALALVNTIVGLRTLWRRGVTREVVLWGVLQGRLITGVVDEITYAHPDPTFERGSSAAARPRRDPRSTAVFPQARQQSLDDLLARSAVAGQQPPDTRRRTAYIIDHKTRAGRAVGVPPYRAPAELQTMLYHRLLADLALRRVRLEVVLELMGSRRRKMWGAGEKGGLDAQKVLSDGFVAQMLGVYEQGGGDGQEEEEEERGDFRIPEGATLKMLWDMMLQALDHALYVTPAATASTPPITLPTSTPDLPSRAPETHTSPSAAQPQHTSPPSLGTGPLTGLSPILTLRYISSATGKPLGQKSFLHDPKRLDRYLEESNEWWTGARSAKGVGEEDAWKCRSCDFRDGCDWRLSRMGEAAGQFRARVEGEEGMRRKSSGSVNGA